MSSPTKEQELQILSEAVQKLGSHSYCGPWLASHLDSLARDMRSDIIPGPVPSLLALQLEAAKIRSDARKEADAMIERAREEAGNRIAAAEREIQSKRISFRRSIESLLTQF